MKKRILAILLATAMVASMAVGCSKSDSKTNETTKKEIFNKMETARECGYSTDDEECEMGMRCVAVPIRNYTGEIIAGLSVSGPTTRMTLENIQEKVPYLLEISKKISRRLGAEI